MSRVFERGFNLFISWPVRFSFLQIACEKTKPGHYVNNALQIRIDFFRLQRLHKSLVVLAFPPVYVRQYPIRAYCARWQHFGLVDKFYLCLQIIHSLKNRSVSNVIAGITHGELILNGTQNQVCPLFVPIAEEYVAISAHCLRITRCYSVGFFNIGLSWLWVTDERIQISLGHVRFRNITIFHYCAFAKVKSRILPNVLNHSKCSHQKP